MSQLPDTKVQKRRFINSDEDKDDAEGGMYVAAYMVLQLLVALCFGCGLVTAIGMHLAGYG